MTDPLAQALAANNLSPDQFQDASGNEGIFTGVVPHKGVVDLWVKLARTAKETGYFPVIRGAADDDVDDQFEHDPAEILAAAPTGSVRELLMPRLRQQVESLKSFFDELPEPSQSELTVALDREPPDFDTLAAAVDRSGVNSFGGKTAPAPWPAELEAAPPIRFHTARSNKGKPMRMSLVRLQKSWELPAHLNFGGWNDAPDPALQVAMLREWRQQYEAIPVFITGDVLECLVLKPPQTPEQAMQLAAEQWIFCDDIVGQGTQSIRNLAIEIWQSKTWFFWWD